MQNCTHTKPDIAILIKNELAKEVHLNILLYKKKKCAAVWWWVITRLTPVRSSHSIYKCGIIMLAPETKGMWSVNYIST